LNTQALILHLQQLLNLLNDFDLSLLFISCGINQLIALLTLIKFCSSTMERNEVDTYFVVYYPALSIITLMW